MGHYRKGFQSLTHEITRDQLPVRGALPPWLAGTLVRNGPGQFEIGSQSYRHWFDGLAMLHRFTFADGHVSYANRFLHTPAYRKDTETGKINFRGFSVDPCRSLFSRVMAVFLNESGSNTNVGIAHLADRYLAMTETPIAVEFDPHTLETLGVFDYEDAISGQVTTAHPHFDARRGLGYNYLLKLNTAHHYIFYAVEGGKRREVARIPVQMPSYMHSFGMTDRYLILAEFPFVLPGIFDLVIGARPFITNYRWMPERGTRFLIVDKDDGSTAAIIETEAFFAFHHINAFERHDEIILDIAAYRDASSIDRLRLDNLRRDDSSIPVAEFRRYRLPLKGRSAHYERISGEAYEMPAFDYARCAGQSYRYAYGVGMDEADFMNRLLKIDTLQGEAKVWHELGCYPGEPVFVRAPGTEAEDAGVILSLVLDGRSGTSFLLVLDAATFVEIARAEAPHAIPFGFHGQFYPLS